jgi:hypothetical protein
MPLPLPRLDDRSFDQLLREAKAVVQQHCPAWTDLSPSDPGTTLLEVFAYLTEVMLYRLNRIPEKVHVALLNLLGVAPLPPAAARVTLVFSRSGDTGRELRVAAGMRVSDPAGGVVFTTLEDAVLVAGAASASAAAIHAEAVEGELLGLGTGEPRQSMRLRRPPILRRGDPAAAVAIGVRALPGEMAGLPPARALGGEPFLLWQEVRSFLDADATARGYVLDRHEGLVLFGPGPAGGVPAKGREIRAWYWRGGGRAGNVAAGTLTTLRSPVAGVAVTNPERAAGGEDGETLEEALRRGRDTVGALRTAVTAGDFARVAVEAGGIARGQAMALRDRQPFAEPGLVEVRVVPRIEPGPDGAVTPAVLAAHQTAALLERVDRVLAERRPLGVRTRAAWTRCRPVGVTARVVVAAAAAPAEMRDRLVLRLNTLLAPHGSWPFGRVLRASDIYEVLLAEPGVRYAEGLRFAIDAGLDAAVRDVVRDRALPRSFAAATAAGLFRSQDRGISWTPETEGLPDPAVVLVRPDDETPGLVAAVSQSADGDVWSVAMSADAGEHWVARDRLQGERIWDAAWARRNGQPVLLLATQQALRRLERAGTGGSATVDRLQPRGGEGGDDRAARSGLFAIAAQRHPGGTGFVAVAARDRGGVLLSMEDGEPGTFLLLPDTQGRDVRVLAFQRDGDRVFLWAGCAAEAGGAGESPRRIEARQDGVDPAGWQPGAAGWNGGSCEGIDFAGPLVVAASNRAGVLCLESGGAQWRGATIDSGLPADNDRRALRPVLAVAAGEEDGERRILAATGAGLFMSTDDGRSYAPCGRTALTEQVPLPQGWLFCAGPHDLSVVRESGEA